MITRNFNIENTSIWSIDKKPASEKKVRQLVESLNVKVDNPCQVLPQDRVKDFVNMNQQELLKNTMFDISGSKAVQLFDELITLQNRISENKNKLATNVKQLQEEQNAAEG